MGAYTPAPAPRNGDFPWHPDIDASHTAPAGGAGHSGTALVCAGHMRRVGRLVAAAAIAWATVAGAEEPGDWPRTIELPTFAGEGPFVTVPANVLGMPTLVLVGGTATLACTPFDLLRGLSVGGGYGSVAAACASRVGGVAGSAAYILGGAPFWVTKQVFWNAPRALLRGTG